MDDTEMIIIVAMLNEGWRFRSTRRVVSPYGLSPTVTNMGGGGSQGVKVAVPR